MAHADGSVVAAVRGRDGGNVVGGRGGIVSSVSPNQGVIYMIDLQIFYLNGFLTTTHGDRFA